MPAEKFDGVRHARGIRVVNVRFVEHDQNVCGHAIQEIGEVGGAERGTRRIVGIREINDRRLRGDRASQRRQIVGEFAHR